MGALAEPRMSVAEFYRWAEQQDLPYELIGGTPVLRVRSPEETDPRMMAAASPRHGRIATNVVVSLASQLQDGPCEVYQSENGAETAGDHVRLPDVVVDCSGEVPTDGSLPRPTIVFEVLSLSTRGFDVREKLAEYKRVPSIVAIVLVEQEFAEVEAHHRVTDDAWRTVRHLDLTDVLSLPSIEAQLPLSVIYRRAPIGERPGPRPYLAATK